MLKDRVKMADIVIDNTAEKGVLEASVIVHDRFVKKTYTGISKTQARREFYTYINALIRLTR